MFRYIAVTSLTLLMTTSVLSAQEASAEQVEQVAQSEEALAWEAVKNSEASADVFAFIEEYPNGEFVKEAKARMIDLLWVEMAQNPVPASEITLQQEVVNVSFGAPLEVGAPEIIGKTIEELIAGSPLFPPVEGLPEEYWKEQECSNCHEWETANLCTQANTYLTDAGSENLTKQHPYGGTFKLNLRNWAVGGCQ